MEAINPDTLYYNEYYVNANPRKINIPISPGGYFVGIIGHVQKSDMVIDDSGYVVFKVAQWGYRDPEPTNFIAEIKIPFGWGFNKAGHLFHKPLENVNSAIPYVIFAERIPSMKFITIEALPRGY